MPVIIFGGVYSGVFTATEAGAVSVFYGLLAGWIIYPVFFKTKADVALSTTIRNSAVNSAAIALLIASAALVGRMVALGGVTQQLIDFLMGITTSKYIFILVINLIFFVIGMLLETCTSIVLFTPILVPIAIAYGIDPVHFGAIMLLNLEIGLITPPFAANLFVACRMSNTTMDEIIKPLLPFYGVCLPVLLITSYFPALILWLPKATG
ncbi:MAG: Sialic acid TRAP transporter permease protein SiaT [Smithella sp. PtaU1.Bin162]|nr:MAG: Sialic acid TRAP transporter permease protein SiaT [Smithella sp. PtaU1.Bin162]